MTRIFFVIAAMNEDILSLSIAHIAAAHANSMAASVQKMYVAILSAGPAHPDVDSLKTFARPSMKPESASTASGRNSTDAIKKNLIMVDYLKIADRIPGEPGTS